MPSTSGRQPFCGSSESKKIVAACIHERKIQIAAKSSQNFFHSGHGEADKEITY